LYLDGFLEGKERRGGLRTTSQTRQGKQPAEAAIQRMVSVETGQREGTPAVHRRAFLEQLRMLRRNRQSAIECAEGGPTIARTLVNARQVQEMVGLVRRELDGLLTQPATLVPLSRSHGQRHAIVGEELRLYCGFPFEGHIGEGP